MLRVLTAGESHGKCLVAILEGMVAGLKLDGALIDRELERRQAGYGRGGRMLIEKDKAEILSGVRKGETIGSPLAIQILNKDFKIDELGEVKHPRPGHADLAGALKYDRRDARDILERASARETAVRVAVGAVCKQFLRHFGVEILSHVTGIGGITVDASLLAFDTIREAAEKSPVHCADAEATKLMLRMIDAAKENLDTLGGVFEIQVKGLVPGIGSHVQPDRRIDSRIAAGLMSVQAVKGVEFGLGFGVAGKKGSEVHDAIEYDPAKKIFFRRTNRSGGVEGGMTTGETLVVRGAMKPISTLPKGLPSAHLDTKEAVVAAVERSDVTAVPACGVVGEAAVAFEIAALYLEKFGGDSLKETKRNVEHYKAQISAF